MGTCADRNVSEEVFHLPTHGQIYTVMRSMVLARVPLDQITLTQALRDQGKLDQIGGPAFVSELYSFVPTAANISYYLDILIEKFTLRKIALVAAEYGQQAYDHDADAGELLNRFEAAALTISRDSQPKKAAPISELVMANLDEIEAQMNGACGGITGLTTGFDELDIRTGGLQPADYVVIAARTSTGKTAFALNICDHVAIKLRLPVALFSLEMAARKISRRMLYARARVNAELMRSRGPDSLEIQRIRDAAYDLAKAPIIIEDEYRMGIHRLAQRARRIKDQHPDLACIVIDYLQKIRGESWRSQRDRRLEIEEVSSEINALKKELNIPIIVLAQLNRNTEKRQDPRPKMSDLEGSGSIEQDADLITLLYRPERYEDDVAKKAELRGQAELIIDKNRDGAISVIPLVFEESFSRFANPPQSERELHL